MVADDLAGGYRALVEAVAAVDLDRDVLRVAGPDAATYLQGQLSQDVVAMGPGSSAWSLLLQPQGKVDAWLRVTRTADDTFIMDVDAGWGGPTLDRLTRFKLRTKADFEALDWRCAARRGPAALAAPPTATDGAVLASADWPLIGGIDVLGPDVHAGGDIAVASLDAYEVRRIEAGLPRMGSELTDRTIPAEARVVERSVSFTKGCYTGQELVARIDSRGGNVPRRIVGVIVPGPDFPPVGATVVVGGRDAGVITSIARHPDGHAVALALVRRDVDVPADGTSEGAATFLRPLPLLS